MRAIRARILHALSVQPLQWQYIEDGVVVISDGKIAQLGHSQELQNAGFDLEQCEDKRDCLLIPGFIDSHVHSPQIDVIASYSQQLLDWLDKYTFPAETKYADEEYAEKSAGDFLDGLIAAGTTTAMVYVTSHVSATDSFFQAAHARNMRMIAGKVMMDQEAPIALCDEAQQSAVDSKALINKWHGKGRLGYAITPRFAVSSSAAQLAAAGQLHQEFPETWVQTHLSENHEEIAKVAEVHPDSTDYLNVYEKHGLLTDRAVFGHCLHLSDSEIKRMSDAGGKVAFCPTSNLFLGSGLLDLEKLLNANVDVSMASDVGGGTSLSMLRTLADAYKVCQLQGYSFDPMHAFAMTTLGNAEALSLSADIGNFVPGKEADMVLIKAEKGSILSRRLDLATSIEEEMFIYITMGDEAVVAETIINGESAQ